MEIGPDPAWLYLIFATMMALAIATWCLGLWVRYRSFGPRAQQASSGEVEVNLPPETACREIASRLTSQPAGLSARILTCTSEELTARLYPFWASDASLGQQPERGGTLSCTISHSVSGSRIAWIADGRPLNRMLSLVMNIILGLGALGLVAIGLIMPLLVIPHPEPAVRWQVVQTVQLIHLLWPPFLIAHIAGRRRALVETRVSDLLNNLRFT